MSSSISSNRSDHFQITQEEYKKEEPQHFPLTLATTVTTISIIIGI